MDGWEVRPCDRRRDRRRLRWLLVLVLCIPLAFWLGTVWHAMEPPTGEAFDTSQVDTEDLEQRMTVLLSADQVARQADERNRKTIKQLEEQIFNLQQDLAFYKGVLAPGSRREGLRIRSFELQSTADPRVFRYSIMLSRVGPDNATLAGNLEVSLVGRSAGKEARLELEKLSSEHKEPAIAFEFKHFQAIPTTGRSAELKLPADFEPEKIVVKAQVDGQDPLERTFKWTEVD